MKQFFTFLFTAFAVQLSFSQNIGIGLNNPTRARFELNGAVGATNAIFGGETTGISLQSNWPGIGFNQYWGSSGRYIASGYAGTQYLDAVSGGMHFDLYASGVANGFTPAGVRTLSLFPSGNVGIRGAYTDATLAVARGTGFQGTAVFYGTQHNSHFNYSSAEHTYIRAGKTSGNVYINNVNSGKVLVGYGSGPTRFGINSGDPTYTLEVVQAGGTGLILINPQVGYHNWELNSTIYSPSSTCLQLTYDETNIKGWFRPTDGGYTQNSDLRLKTNVEKVPSILGRIMQLNVVRYEMKDNNPEHEKSYGFIAQEVKQVFPDLVTVRPAYAKNKMIVPDLHSLSYAGFGVLAIKAIQEQQAIIEKQNQEITDLKGRLAKVEKLLFTNQ